MSESELQIGDPPAESADDDQAGSPGEPGAVAHGAAGEVEAAQAGEAAEEVGRASCRERVSYHV